MIRTLLIISSGIILLGPLLAGAAAIVFHRMCRYGRPNTHCPGILIHSVTEKRVQGLSHVRATVFKALCEHLYRAPFHAVTVSEACTKKGNGGHPCVALTFDDAFEDIYSVAFPILKEFEFRATICVIAGYISRCSTWDVFPPRPHCTGGQLREIAGSGWEIGSHTLTHPDLLLLDDQGIRHEMTESRKLLEDIVSKPVVTISFPFGRWNRRIWELAQECGYEYGAVYGGTGKIRDTRLLEVEGAYSFDRVEDIIERLGWAARFSNSRARSRIMPHFAKGAPLWRFRPSYRMFKSA
jgi:peptidoglycan/xylan/chitin deacetylase (PgdA/CDA1 family)